MRKRPCSFIASRAWSGATEGRVRIIVLTSVQEDAEVLSNTRLPAISVYPDKDKVTRARALAARYEAGKVFHLRGAPGLDAYESEAVAFPNGAFDDRVDAMVYAADLNPTTAEFSFTSMRL